MRLYPGNTFMRMLTLALCALLLLSALPLQAAAAGSADAGVTSVMAQGDKIQATLYGYNGTVSTKVYFYVDGTLKETSAAQTVSAGQSITVTSSASLYGTGNCYSVLISDDGNPSNNNRTMTPGSGGGDVGPEQAAALSVSTLTVSPDQPKAGEAVTVTVKVKNTGDAAAAGVSATLSIGGATMTRQVGSLGAGAEQTVTFSWIPEREGDYTASVSVTGAGGLSASKSAGVTVNPQETPPVQNKVKEPVSTVSGIGFAAATLNVGYDPASQGEVPDEYTLVVNGKTYTTTGDKVYVSGLTAGRTYSYTVTAKKGEAVSVEKTFTLTTRADGEKTGGIDLVVTDILWDPAQPAAGDSVTFSAVITNQGTQPSKAAKHGVRFYVDDESNGRNNTGTRFFWCDTYTASLASGASIVVQVNGNSSMGGNAWSAVTGTHTITVFADDANLTGDNNRANNYLSKQVSVSAGPSLDIPDGPTGGATVYTTDSYGGGMPIASNLAVTVNNKTSAVFNAEVNTARYWNYRWKTTMPVTIFELKEGTGSATVRVKTTKNVTSAVVRPLSAGITPAIETDGNGEKYICFDVTKCGSYSLEFNGSADNALQIFVNPPYSENHGSGTYIGLGEVRNGVPAFGTVRGSGIVLNNHGGSQATNAYSGARIEGITLLNSYDTSWEVEIRGQSGITFDYFHIIASGSNSDGISIQGSSWITIQNCYFRTWDDAVVLKNQYTGGNTHDITVDNCVFWSDLAQAMEIGAETNKQGCVTQAGGPQIYNAAFTNSTVIHAFHKPAMSIHNMDNARVHDIRWENITIEDAQMGRNSVSNGSQSGGDGWPLIIDLTNVMGGELPGTAASWSTNGTARGSIYDITFKNIQVLSWQNDTGKAPGMRALNSEWGGTISGITVDNLSYGGTRITSLTQLQAIAHCQFTHQDTVAGAWSGATSGNGHDSSYNCRGTNYHSAESFNTSNLTIR